MNVYFGSDHAGHALKESLREHVKSKGINVVDMGVFTETKPVDYPDIAKELAAKVAIDGDLGILICGTGIGMSIAANKVKGIRAAHVGTPTEARFARLHNNANILTLGQRITGVEVAKDCVDSFLSTEFEGGRHDERVKKIMALEEPQK